MMILQSALAAVVCLGSLILLHEFGHFVVARLCGVKVLRFSIGFGSVLWSVRLGRDQTEWAISALPLGGYVKMLDARGGDLGDLPEADLRREFTRQNVWKRIAIIAAGPLTNLLIAIALFTGVYIYGVDEPVATVTLRAIEPRAAAAATPAWQAGLRDGDTVKSVNGQAVVSWADMRWQLVQSAIDKQGARLVVERPGQGRLHVEIPAAAMAATDPSADVPSRLGLSPALPPPVISDMEPGSPAARAGLQRGDLLLAVDGKPVRDGVDFIAIVRGAANKVVQLRLRRGGQELVLPVTPQPVQVEDYNRKGTVTVGKIGALLDTRAAMITVRSSPIAAVGKACARVWDTSVMSLKMIGKMVTGEASLKNVTGPIAIADYAGKTAQMGVSYYLNFTAFVSISLAVMNLLPIPVLDGGYLLYYSLEVLTGRSVSRRFFEIAQGLGFGLLIALMALAMFNDVSQRL